MNVNGIDVVYTSIDTMTAFDLETGDFMFTIDELQNLTISQGEDKVDLTGRNGRKISSLKRNKTVTISGASGMVSAGLMEMQTGGVFEKAVAIVKWDEELVVGDDKTAEITYTPVGTTGNEIKAVYVKSGDVLGKLYTQNATAGNGTFSYAGKKITFSEDLAGAKIFVTYMRKIQATQLVNYVDKFSKKCKLYADGTCEDGCAKQYRMQWQFPKVDFSGTFELAMGDSQTIHNFEAEALANNCIGNGELWTYTIFGVNEKDAEEAAA